MRHTVGLVDAITAADLTARVNDGLPETLDEAVDFYGCSYFKLKVSDLLSKKRVRNIARPRQIAMALAKDLTQMSLPEIGDAFGGRDHTTVLHACRTIAAHREKNHEINRDYHVLEQVLKG